MEINAENENMIELNKKGRFNNIAIYMLMILVALLLSSIPSAIVMLKEVNEMNNSLMNSEAVQLSMLFGTILSIITIIITVKFIHKKNVKSLGLKKEKIIKNYVRGLIIGFCMFSFVYLISVVTGAVKFEGINTALKTNIGTIILFFLGFLFQGAEEEIMIRGYLMNGIAGKHKIWVAIFGSSLVFAILHVLNDGISIIAFINLMLIAIFFALYAIYTDNLWGVCGMHSMWNFLQGNFYGIKVSGLNIKDSVMYSSAIEGKEILNGGAFGAEGGLIVTAVTIIFIISILLLIKKSSKK